MKPDNFLEIFLFGGVTIKKNGAPVTGLASRKAEALLAYLAHTGRPHSRETLADLLWDDRPQAQAMGNLRVLLSSLRKHLGPYVTITRHEVAFNRASSHMLDTAELVGRLADLKVAGAGASLLPAEAAPQLAQTVALYRGDFLAGFHIRDCLGFEEWALVEQERLRRLAMEGLQMLAAHYLRVGNYQAGIEQAARLLELDPLREEAHRQMMLLLARSGRRSAALQQYETCAAVLQAELGVDPLPETTALYDRVRTAPAAPPASLPADPTPFVGRGAELAEIASRLADPACRLLTLVGPGGIGKTRLAVQAARHRRRAFLHGVYFVSLSPLDSPESIVPAIAQTMRVDLPGANPAAELLDYLREKELLLVLDNFEHLLDGAALAAQIVQNAPLVQILVTSRERLNLRAEWLFNVPGLDFPTGEATATGVAPEARGAVQLFIHSARRIQPDFSATPADYAAIARICRLLQGTPLGIELAAAWVRAFPCDEIATEIETGFDFLTTSLRDLPRRHRSLRAVFDHSWQLLSDGEKQAARKLSVFRDPFRRQAAQAVAGATASLLLTLVDSSFLSQTPDGRYDLHVLLKQYAAEKLAAHPAEQQETQDRLAQFYARFLQRRELAFRGNEQSAALVEIGAEIEDIRAAWQWAIARQNFAALDSMLESLYLFYWRRNWFLEGKKMLAQAVAAIPPTKTNPLLPARLRARLADFESWLDNYDTAQTLLKTAAATFRQLQAHKELALALDVLGRIAYWTGEFSQAAACFEEGLALCRRIDDRWGAALALNNLANAICDGEADYARAWPLYKESLALSQQLGDRNGQARALINQGATAQAQKNYRQARRLYEQSLRLYREIDYRHGIAAALNYLGQVTSLLGEYGAPRSFLEESLDLNREAGDRHAIVSSLKHLGHVNREMGNYPEARRRYRQALRLALEIGVTHLVLSTLLGWARLLEKEGQPEDALRLLACVRQQPLEGQELKDEIERCYKQIAAGLSPEAVTRCRRQGEAKTLVEVAAEILAE